MTSWMIQALGDERRRKVDVAVGEHLLADVGFLGMPNAGKRYVVHKLTIVCVFVLFFFCKEGTFLECSSRKLTKQPRFPL